MKKIQIYDCDEGLLFEHECENNTQRITIEEAHKQGICLAKAYLYGWNLEGVKLQCAKLNKAFLRHTIFKKADLTGSQFQQAVCSFTNFEGAILTDTDFCHAIIDQAKGLPHDVQYSPPVPKDANIKKIYILDHNNESFFKHECENNTFAKTFRAACDRFATKFRNVDLRGRNLGKVNAHRKFFGNTTFCESVLPNSRFGNCEFEIVDFQHSNCSQSHFFDCIFNNVNFRDADLRNVKFEDCKFTDVDFTGARIEGAQGLPKSLKQAKIRGLKCD